jgi:PAS domain S-box-containing protein
VKSGFSCPDRMEGNVSTERPLLTPDGRMTTPRLRQTAPKARVPVTARGGFRLITESEGATVATDGAGRIMAWNLAAEELLGHRASEVKGKHLHEVLQSRDIFGNRISCECGVREMLRRGEQVRRYVIAVTSASGEAMRVVLFAHPQLSSASRSHVYEVRPDARRQQGDRRSSDRSPARARVGSLTPAELRILRLLAEGKRARDAATLLGVSLTTVRNHIQHLFRKLRVHTQGEAISLALRSGLV